MQNQSSTEMEVTVMVDEGHLPRIKEVAAQLRAVGLRDINTLGSIGAITGRVSSALLGKLQTIPGASAIETSGSIQIAPPESGIQ